ncbi:alpha/beta hydrolase [Dinoroseobacter sp. S124A]|uniref:alpha/beta hydrolase n=1 Tax=Dinoroseobacter sp. S124A TaxID=3415128 RepID=UPI003C7CA834
MPVLNLTVTPEDIRPAQSGRSLNAALGRAAARGDSTAPIVLLLHGYRYSPLRGPSNPHDSLYATMPCAQSLPRRKGSWPMALGFRDAETDPGLCLPVGWDARGRFAEAFGAAEQVGARLAALITRLNRQFPARPIHVMAHSLGARVVLAAMARLPGAMIQRVILLAPADLADHAETVLGCPGAQGVEVLQISPTENWLFDRLLEQALRRHPQAGPALGRRPPEAERWVSLTLDSDAELANLAALGHAVAPRHHRVCHWSAYLRDGAMDLYSALLTERGPRALRELAPPRPLASGAPPSP